MSIETVFQLSFEPRGLDAIAIWRPTAAVTRPEPCAASSISDARLDCMTSRTKTDVHFHGYQGVLDARQSQVLPHPVLNQATESPRGPERTAANGRR